MNEQKQMYRRRRVTEVVLKPHDVEIINLIKNYEHKKRKSFDRSVTCRNIKIRKPTLAMEHVELNIKA